MKTRFEWGEDKGRKNQEKHKVSFSVAQRAFLDPNRVIAEDITHSQEEERFYCIGRVDDGIVTVRFTFRENVIRIFGAGYWRKGKKIYEEKNKIHR
jgi:uncharacterized DUF497 family protein